MMNLAKEQEPRRTAAELFPLIATYLSGIATQQQFCAEHELPLHVFHYWLKKYREQEKLSSSKKDTGTDTAFLPVHITPPGVAESSVCEISYPSGITIRFNQPVDVAVLRQLVENGRF